ncbi:hypothetical protein Trco_000153 [Trichoderma cornu-damae]|uniref:AAA+ ATPase domain-containing protein n=1 Tax=Trichoderma cornu-damae TaxID=654480 RepID=A0A9P8TZ06_9HYPO|nr:hypothetical protein Trco_000153 [Trichoderma cornu-damae]
MEEQKSPAPSTSCPKTGPGAFLGAPEIGDTTQSQSELMISTMERLQQSMDRLFDSLPSLLLQRSSHPDSSAGWHSDPPNPIHSPVSLASSAVPTPTDPYCGERDFNDEGLPSLLWHLAKQPSSRTRLPSRASAISEPLPSLPLWSPSLPLRPATTEKQDSDSDENQSAPIFRRIDHVWNESLERNALNELGLPTDHSVVRDGNCIFVVHQEFDQSGNHTTTFVEITHKLFKECLQTVMGNNASVSFAKEAPRLDPTILYLYLDDFRSYFNSLAQAKPCRETNLLLSKTQKTLSVKRGYLRLLIDYLEADFAEVEKSLGLMLRDGVITFDMLWALWKPSTLAYSPTYCLHELPGAFVVTSMMRHCGNFPWQPVYSAEMKYVDFDGKTLAYKTVKKEVRYFAGAVKITSLPFYPLQYHKDEAQVRRRLTERGAKFVSLHGAQHKSFAGMAFSLIHEGEGETSKFEMERTRIMVDPVAFRKANPHHFEATDLPAEYTNDDDTFNDGMQPRSLLDTMGIEKAGDDAKSGQGLLIRHGEGEEWARLERAKNNLLLLCCPVVVGFSLSRLDWFEFEVDGIGDIEWDGEAWSSLVLEQETKELLRASVASQIYNPACTADDDAAEAEGKGLSIVLHGPPGTGKTLTVKGLCDHLRHPLLVISARELGYTPDPKAVSKLQKLLAAGHRWGAIVLIEDSDALLEKHGNSDMEPDSIKQVVLNHLESFRGVVFLTSSHVRAFDEALQSRVDIALKYDKLDKRGKRTLLERAVNQTKALGRWEVEPFSDED